MATLEQLTSALIQADAAGNSADAQVFADEIRKMRQASPVAKPAPQERIDPTGSVGENFMAGLGKSFADTGRGLKQLIDVPAQYLEQKFGGQGVGRALGLPTAQESAQATQADIDEAKRLDAPLMRTAGGLIGNIVGQTAMFAVPGMAIARAAPVVGAANLVGRVAPKAASLVAPAISGAAIGAAQPVATGDSRLEQSAFGAVGGAAGQILSNGIGKLAAGAKSAVSPEVAKLLEAARARGIPVTADQALNSKPLNALRAALDYVPFSGSGAVKDGQQRAFNKAISSTVGETSENVGTALQSAEKRLSAEFDAMLKNNDIRTSGRFLESLNGIREGAKNELSESQMSVVNAQLHNLVTKLDADGVINGQAAYNVKKSLDRLASSNDSTLAYWAKQIRGTVMDELNDSAGPEAAKAFAKTREQWGNLRELQKMVQAGAEGNITPARLANNRNIRSQDLSEIRDIGAQFLKGRFGDSGTTQRAAGLGALFGGALLEPTTALTAAGVGSTVGRGANALLSSPAATNYLMRGSPTLGAALPYTNALLPVTGAASVNALK